MRSPYQNDFVRRSIAGVLTSDPLPPTPKGRSTMPKILEQHEFKAPDRGFQSKYDWNLILSGKIVQLDAGSDYDAVGHAKDGKEFDRTDAFKNAIKARAYDAKKKVKIDELLSKKGDKVVGLVIQATPMTPEEIAGREKALAERQKNAGKNGDGTPSPEAAEGVAPE
jgi:hypothetical protein